MSPASDVTAAAAIRHHYDVGNEFFALWLDPSLSYSCALRGAGDDDLATAQERKLAHHLDAVRAAEADRVLDVGCGWGAVLARRAQVHPAGRGVGLTLSAEQARYVEARAGASTEVRLESWTEHEPTGRYDGIVSIGAFEHFARPEDGPAEKLGRYRDFFTRCRSWLHDGGALSLQTIAYGNMTPGQASGFFQQEVFPAAELPTPAEIAAAVEGLFEITSVANGRLDYAWTCEQWARRLRARRAEAVELVGPETVRRYERYLRQASLGFRMGKLVLLRLVLRPWPAGYFGPRR
ncbi:cyclopropane-fatty-acyl-phospholipid synthase [Pseudonocardia sp. CNS-139]|nr:cyclopropane-fatty-acyl-phospholipid synthase [Pseudonocardia sp. CNS-139]